MSDSMPADFTLSNFRLSDEIPDWPLGGGRRGVCVFSREANKKGQRILRTTTGKPKASRYYPMICLADGSDGRTHLVGLTDYGFVAIMSSDMQHSEYSVFMDSDTDRYVALVKELTKVCEVSNG